MTDNEIKREKTFSEELLYFKERIKEVFDNYDNPNGNEDPLCIAVLRDSNRIVRKAEEEINRQKAEIEKLKGSTIVSNIMESQRIKREAKAEAYKEFAERLNEEAQIADCFDSYNMVVGTHFIDNLLKEMIDE